MYIVFLVKLISPFFVFLCFRKIKKSEARIKVLQGYINGCKKNIESLKEEKKKNDILGEKLFEKLTKMDVSVKF